MKSALTEAQVKASMRNRVSIGESFLQNKDFPLVEDETGVITAGDIAEILEDYDGPSLVKNGAGLMVKNLWEYINLELNETTRILNIGDFDKFAYPMVTIVYPNLVAHTLVSVQPMDGPVSLIFYLNALYNANKGATAAGDNIITSPNANYASESIEDEGVGTGDGTPGAYTGTVDWPPVRPSSISASATTAGGVETFTDNGTGTLTGDLGGTGTIDYNTGAYSMTFNGNCALGNAIVMTYEYVQEGNPLIPEIDISLAQIPVTARRRSLVAKWTLEGAYNLKKLHGADAETELIAVATNEIKFGIDQSIITNLWNGTTATHPVWSSTPGAGVSYAEHQLSFIKELNAASNRIFKNSGRAEGEWMVVGVDVATIVESLPGYDKTGKLTGRGVYQSGRLNDKFDIIKNGYFTDTNYLMGYKGASMVDTGYVWSPYLLFFTTATIMLPDFISRKGFASMSGQRMVDNNFFCKGSTS